MSQLTDLYDKSSKNTVKDAREIPTQATNFIDVPNQWQTEFTTDRKPGGPTDFTDKALDYYASERNGMIVPQSFVKQGDPALAIELNRYSPDPDKTYYKPGEPGSFGKNV